MSSVVGGMGTILGPAGGGFILTLAAEALRISDEFMVLTFVIIFIPVLLFTPGGLITGIIIPRIKALFRRGSSKE
jgi:ABC-type branched-subunit amino acid transport system permease subunit